MVLSCCKSLLEGAEFCLAWGFCRAKYRLIKLVQLFFVKEKYLFLFFYGFCDLLH
jgi:hypothetical protein